MSDLMKNLENKTRIALEEIETGRVRWGGRSVAVRFEFDPDPNQFDDYSDYWQARHGVDLSFLSESLYSREGFETDTAGWVSLTPRGQALLAELRESL